MVCRVPGDGLAREGLHVFGLGERGEVPVPQLAARPLAPREHLALHRHHDHMVRSHCRLQ